MPINNCKIVSYQVDCTKRALSARRWARLCYSRDDALDLKCPSIGAPIPDPRALEHSFPILQIGSAPFGCARLPCSARPLRGRDRLQGRDRLDRAHRPRPCARSKTRFRYRSHVSRETFSHIVDNKLYINATMSNGSPCGSPILPAVQPCQSVGFLQSIG